MCLHTQLVKIFNFKANFRILFQVFFRLTLLKESKDSFVSLTNLGNSVNDYK